MRPSSVKEDLPSAYNVKNHLRKEFVARMEELKEEIKVSMNMFATSKSKLTIRCKRVFQDKLP